MPKFEVLVTRSVWIKVEAFDQEAAKRRFDWYELHEINQLADDQGQDWEISIGEPVERFDDD